MRWVLKIIPSFFSYFSTKTNVVKGHSVCLYGEIWKKICIRLSLLSPLMWNAGLTIYEIMFVTAYGDSNCWQIEVTSCDCQLLLRVPIFRRMGMMSSRCMHGYPSIFFCHFH